jgi:hypothetical protein
MPRQVVKPAKDVSLAGELIVLQHAVEAAALLLDADGTGEPDVPAVRGALGTLAILASRIELLRRAVVGAVDPAVLHAPHNAVIGPPRSGDDPDVLLSARTKR